MKHKYYRMLGIVIFSAISLTTAWVRAESSSLMQATVAFGRGLNTAQPGNAVNHVIIPDDIKVKQDGVVHFLVSGFHQIVAYKAGLGLDDINDPFSTLFIDDPITPDPVTQFYLGLNPAGGPPPGTPATTNPSNASNRVESISFTEPGTYLVICNVVGHFNDGMFAYVKVLPGRRHRR